MNYFEKINNVTISVEDLWFVQEVVTEIREEEDIDLTTLLFVVADLYKDDPIKAGALMFRMIALARLVIEEGAPGWTLPAQPDGTILAQKCVFAAAALEPILEEGKQLKFDKQSFLAKVLELSEVKGNA